MGNYKNTEFEDGHAWFISINYSSKYTNIKQGYKASRGQRHIEEAIYFKAA
jgi:hypothetical protein